MTAWEFLIDLHKICHFISRERKLGRASHSELKRWCHNQAVIFNGESVKWDEAIDFHITSLVLFPKSRNKVTLY